MFAVSQNTKFTIVSAQVLYEKARIPLGFEMNFFRLQDADAVQWKT